MAVQQQAFPVSINAAFFNTDFVATPLCREVSFLSSSYLYPNNSFWQFGDGNSVNTNNNTSHVYSAAGNYTVTLINTYNGCKDTISKTVKVEDLVNFNSSIESPSAICIIQNANFKSKSTVNASNSSWEFGDGGISYGTNVNHTYITPGTYTVKLTNTFGTCKETVTKNITINALPDIQGFVVDYGGVCGAPVTVKFKDTTAGAVKWEWRLYYYGTIFSTQQNATYNFASDGVYTIVLTVTNAGGCVSTVSRNIFIYRPFVSINYISSSSFRGYYDCDSLKIKFSTYANQPLISYSWTLGDGTTSTEATPEHLYNKEGVYPITLTYKTESGCTGTTSYSVRVYGKPKADFSYTVPCGNSLNLQFTDRSYFSDNWQWSTGGGYPFAYWSNPFYTFPDTGKYNVTFINSIGHCSDTIAKVVYANTLPSFVAITKTENTCEGNHGTIIFDQHSVRIERGTWDFGDGITLAYDTSKHVIKHTYVATGRYTVTLTGIAGNCQLRQTAIVTVLLKQNPLFTANKTEICSNESVNISISNMEINPYTGNVPYGQYYIFKFEDDKGKPFTGNYSNYYWNYTSFTTTLSNFTAGTTKIRAIISNGYTGCNDTTAYINLKVNGPVAGFKVLNNNICYKTPFIFQDTQKR